MAREDRPSMPWYVKDWFSSEDRPRMTYEARGIYRELLDYSWLHHGIPSDRKEIADWLGITERKLALVWGMMASCWVERDGRLFNEKQERVRGDLQAYKAERSASGRKGNAKRWGSDRKVAIAERSQAAIPQGSPAFASASSEEEKPQPPVAEWPKAPRMDSHRGHVNGYCDWICLPEFLFNEFVNKCPSGIGTVDTWAKRVKREWSGREISEDNLAFWRKRWAERGAAQPDVALAALERRGQAHLDRVAQLEAAK
jgi:hypothetical protein